MAQLERLEVRFEESQERARTQLAALNAAGLDPEGRIASAYESGDHLSVFRATRRHGSVLTKLKQLTELKKLKKEEHASPDAPARPLDDTPADRYRRAAAGMTTSLRLASAPDQVPEGAGPYNGDMLAARILIALESISESYLASLIERLDDLGALLALPDARARRRRKGG
jgi:hypothetical protein